MLVEEPRLPIRCPLCAAGVGVPHRQVPDAQTGGVRVLLRCDRCSHRWSMIVAAETGAREP